MIRKHPLFWKEWKSAKWWSMLVMGILLIMFLSINNKLQYVKKMINGLITGGNERYLDSFSIFETFFSEGLVGAALAILPIVIIVTTLLFQSDRKESIGAFVSSLPFTKKEQFKVKWFVGARIISIPFAVTTLLTLLMRISNWGWIKGHYAVSISGSKIMPHDTLVATMLSLLQVYLFFIAFYSFLMLIQTLIANNIAASIIGVIVLAVPWFVIETGVTTLYRMLNKPVIRFNHESWSLFYSLMLPKREYMKIDTMWGSLEVFSYEHLWIKIIVLLLVIGLSLYGGIQFYGKNDNSRNGQLVMFDWVEKILVVGFTICLALLGNTEFRILLIKNTNVFYEMITLIMSAIIGYIMIRKILRLSGGVKYD